VTDAGTPGISDPGAVLVRLALEAGVEVSPVPGPAAAIALLSVSGLDTHSFVFEGFLPLKSGRKRRALEALAPERRCSSTVAARSRKTARTDVRDGRGWFGNRSGLRESPGRSHSAERHRDKTVAGEPDSRSGRPRNRGPPSGEARPDPEEIDDI
jgi:hypothetical protein